MKTSKKIRKTNKAVKMYLQQLIKNYKLMKQKIKKIWLTSTIVAVAATICSCNVTRKVTTEASYFQKGDTTTTIVTKTVETYDAKKNSNL